MSDFIIILTTVNSKETAQDISQNLLELNLCACVNIINGVQSVYRWDGKIVKDEEFLLVIKTRKLLYDKVESTLKSIHPYEVPEIVEIPIDNGSSSYLDWIKESTH